MIAQTVNVLNTIELTIFTIKWWTVCFVCFNTTNDVKHLAHKSLLPISVLLDCKETSKSLEWFVPISPSQMVIPIKKSIQEKRQQRSEILLHLLWVQLWRMYFEKFPQWFSCARLPRDFFTDQLASE